MFKCSVCQKLYNSETDYCDCGNDIFDEVSESLTIQNSQFKLNPKQVLSGAIFASCIVLSALVWFGDTPHESVPSIAKKTETVNEVTNIPPIDKIWNNTPANNVSKPYGNLANYKSELQKVLYSNLEETEILDEGRCEIEFKVNKDGKLTNRRIIKEKGGSQFNNLVLKMIKKTNSTQVPPEGYEDTQFKAKVYTENGLINVTLR